eukprot:1193260-Prorocentrum_minimum.AAC.2
MALLAPESFCLSRTILPIDASRKSGSARSRRVCPVGAVSNTMRVYFAYCSSFVNCAHARRVHRSN